MAIIELYEARKESVFERINRVAEERKRAAWAAYTPLPRSAFEDDWLIPALVIIAVLGETGTRSTFGRPQRRSTGATVARPTEMTATAQAYASTGQGDNALVVIRLEPASVPVKKCSRCHSTQPLTAFAADHRYPDRHAAYCTHCREDIRRKRAA